MLVYSCILCLSYLPYTVKFSRGKTYTVIAVFHSIVNLFPQNMTLLTGSVSLQACYCKVFQRITIFYSKRESLPPQMFCCIWYVAMCNAQMPRFVHATFSDLCYICHKEIKVIAN